MNYNSSQELQFTDIKILVPNREIKLSFKPSSFPNGRIAKIKSRKFAIALANPFSRLAKIILKFTKSNSRKACAGPNDH